MTLDLNMSHVKMSDFSFISIVCVYFSHKTEKCFLKVVEILQYFLIKKMSYFSMPCQTMSDLV